MWNKCRKCRRGRKSFRKEELKRSIEMFKRMRRELNREITNPETPKRAKDQYENYCKNYDIAIEAMEEILFDL